MFLGGKARESVSVSWQISFPSSGRTRCDHGLALIQPQKKSYPLGCTPVRGWGQQTLREVGLDLWSKGCNTSLIKSLIIHIDFSRRDPRSLPTHTRAQARSNRGV